MFILENNTSVESLIKVSGSKFIGQVFKIADESEAKIHIQQLKNQHPTASHFCYAYRLGADGSSYRVSDDGEPNGSAGLPMLNVLKSKQLTQALAVVIRYYGGTKLGISGLIQAYKAALEESLQSSNLVKFEKFNSFTISCAIQHIDFVKSKLIKKNIPFQLHFDKQQAFIQFSANDKTYHELVVPLTLQTHYQIHS